MISVVERPGSSAAFRSRVDLGRLVAERDQRRERLALRAQGGGPAERARPPRTAGAASFCTLSRISMITRSAVLRPMPGMRVSIADILGLHDAQEILDARSRQNSERDLRTHARTP